VWCHFKALFKYYKFCSKHFLIRPSLGGENGVEWKNIQIYEWHLKKTGLMISYTHRRNLPQPVACQRDFFKITFLIRRTLHSSAYTIDTYGDHHFAITMGPNFASINKDVFIYLPRIKWVPLLFQLIRYYLEIIMFIAYFKHFLAVFSHSLWVSFSTGAAIPMRDGLFSS